MSHAWESCLNQQKFLKMIVWIHNGQKPLFLFHTRCGDTFPNVAFQNSNLSFNLFQFSFQPKKTPFTIVLWNGAAEIMTHLRHVHAKLLFSKQIFFFFCFLPFVWCVQMSKAKHSVKIVYNIQAKWCRNAQRHLISVLLLRIVRRHCKRKWADGMPFPRIKPIERHSKYKRVGERVKKKE